MQKQFKGYIYKITNNINHKIYIGQTRLGIYKRFLQHKQRSRHPQKYQSHLYEAMRKYGEENFYIETVEEINTCLKDLYAREVYWINYLNTTDNTIGYNIDKGGRGGDITHLLSIEQQEKIKEKIRNYNLGKHQSKETINKRISKNRHRKVMTKGDVTKHIPIDQVNNYLLNGWVLGRKLEDSCKSHYWQNDLNKKLQVAKKISDSTKGRFKGFIKMVNSENHRVTIPPEFEQEYIQKGYVRGYGKRKPRTKRKDI